jgi:hypothetical protein
LTQAAQLPVKLPHYRGSFGLRRRAEAGFTAFAGDQQRRLMDGDYDHHLTQMQKASKVVELSDIAASVQAFPKTEAPETSVRP